MLFIGECKVAEAIALYFFIPFYFSFWFFACFRICAQVPMLIAEVGCKMADARRAQEAAMILRASS